MYHLTVLLSIVQVDYASFSALSSIRLRSSCQQAGLLLGGRGCWLNKLVPGTCKQRSCFPCWLLTGGCSQTLEVLSGPCGCLPLSQSQQQFQILLMLRISVFFATSLFPLLLHISDFQPVSLLLLKAHVIRLTSPGYHWILPTSTHTHFSPVLGSITLIESSDSLLPCDVNQPQVLGIRM